MIELEVQTFREYRVSDRTMEFGAIVRVNKRDFRWIEDWADRDKLVMALARSLAEQLHTGEQTRVYRLDHDGLFREPC